jgi:hypothetical protein
LVEADRRVTTLDGNALAIAAKDGYCVTSSLYFQFSAKRVQESYSGVLSFKLHCGKQKNS